MLENIARKLMGRHCSTLLIRKIRIIVYEQNMSQESVGAAHEEVGSRFVTI
jgi:hypothetical protein